MREGLVRRIVLGAALSAGLAGGAVADAAVEYGRYLASECVTCHQASGQTDGIPAIVGWPTDEFVVALEEYASGERDHDVMRTIANRYDREEMEALAAYFATLEPGDG